METARSTSSSWEGSPPTWRSRGSSRRWRARSPYGAWLDERDARLPLTRAELHSQNDETAARVVAAGGGLQVVIDATGLDGGWDFSLNFGIAGAVAGGAGVRGGAPAQRLTAGDTATTPDGALTLFEAVEKQLGLRLEKTKRAAPVLIIDHIEQKPQGD